MFYDAILVASRLISSCTPALKRRPGTVGVPAWAKAANKRRAQVLLLEKTKTPAQLQAEMRLADVESKKSDFMTTSRVGVHRPKEKAMEGNRFVNCWLMKSA